jgi:excisionase family DNA binding protein
VVERPDRNREEIEMSEAIGTGQVESREVGAEEQDHLPAVLTVDEVAGVLRLNRKTVYEAIKRGQLPGTRRIGGTIRVSRDALLRWLADAPATGKRAAR